MQINSDLYRLFVGPFKKIDGTPNLDTDLSTASNKTSDCYIVSCDFWQFCDAQNKPLNYEQAFLVVDMSQDQLLDICISRIQYSRITNIVWDHQDKQNFQEQFDWIQKQIKEKKLAKALPISFQVGTGEVCNRLLQLMSQLIKNQAGHIYGYWKSNTGFIGSTPEILCQSSPVKGYAETMALAGTWLKKVDQKPDFLDKKIRQEHQFVIDDILNQLKVFKTLTQKPTHVLELPKLFHLQTNFQFQMANNNDFIKAILLLHPTAALGPYPRDPYLMNVFSKFTIQKNRKKFGAPFGFISNDLSKVIVAIRNLSWNKNEVYVYAGCGITSESDYMTEWTEIIHKQESVKKMLGLIHE